MKSIRLTGRPDPDRTPPFFDVVADSEVVEEARLLDWTFAGGGRATVLYSVDARPGDLRAALTDLPAVESTAVSAVGERRAFLLLTLRPAATDLLREMVGTVLQPGLVVVTPVVYREGRVEARFVGEAASLQAAAEAIPDAVDVTVHAVETFRATRTEPAGVLSDRQREAVETALAVGYYDHPRGVTHEDVGAELGCAASTAAEHLQKAEAKLVHRAMGG